MIINKILKPAIFFLLCLFAITTSYSQSNLWAFSYDVGFPLGETSDYIGNTSWRGFTVQGRSFIKPNISVGGSFSWQVFYEQVDEVVEFSYQPEEVDRPINGALSGKQFRYINTLPIMVNIHYYMGDALIDAVRPYAGLSLGTAPTKQRTEVGIIAIDEFNWHFALAPEIGILVPIDTGVDFFGSLKYNLALKANDSITHSYLNIQVGLANLF